MYKRQAYSYTRRPPKITKPRRNVLIRYCTIEACFRHPLNDPGCAKNGSVFGAELAGWGKISRQMSIWDYTTTVSYTHLDVYKRQIPERVRAVLSPLLTLAGLLVSTAYLVDSTYNPFLYFRF